MVLVRDDSWAGFEVKLTGGNPRVLDSAVAGLPRAATAMRTPPATLAVLTPTGPSYCRPDGVSVIAITDVRL